jgi:hypothetical protein
MEDISQLDSDPKGVELGILKDIHKMTFKGHRCEVE